MTTATKIFNFILKQDALDCSSASPSSFFDAYKDYDVDSVKVEDAVYLAELGLETKAADGNRSAAYYLRLIRRSTPTDCNALGQLIANKALELIADRKTADEN